MARPQLVTRTFKTTKCHLLCVDLIAEEKVEKDVVLPRTYKDDKTIIKMTQKQLGEDIKVVKIISKEVIPALYAMSEEKFIENSELMSLRNTNVNSEENE